MGTVKRVSERINIKKGKKWQSKVQRRYKPIVQRTPGKILGLTRNDFGFPDRLQTKLVYGDKINLQLNLGAAQYNAFRMTSLYDPDLTNVGHQPQWFDQLANVYAKYRVKGAKITATFTAPGIPVSATLNGPYMVGVTISSASTLAAGSFASLIEDANSKSTILCTREGGNNVKTITNTYSPSRDLGVDPMESDLTATTSSNPTLNAYAHCWAIDQVFANTSIVYLQVKIEFFCEFFDRIEGVLS